MIHNTWSKRSVNEQWSSLVLESNDEGGIINTWQYIKGSAISIFNNVWKKNIKSLNLHMKSIQVRVTKTT